MIWKMQRNDRHIIKSAELAVAGTEKIQEKFHSG
jgi:hypothetical protein